MDSEYYYILIGSIFLIFVILISLSKDPIIISIFMPLLIFIFTGLVYSRYSNDSNRIKDNEIKYYRALHPSETALKVKENNSINISKSHNETYNDKTITQATPGHVVTNISNDGTVDLSTTKFSESISIDDELITFKVSKVDRTVDYQATITFTLKFNSLNIYAILLSGYNFNSNTLTLYKENIDLNPGEILTKTFDSTDVLNGSYQFRITTVSTDNNNKRNYDIVFPLEQPTHDETAIKDYTGNNYHIIPGKVIDFTTIGNCTVLSRPFNDEYSIEEYCADTVENCAGFQWNASNNFGMLLYNCGVDSMIGLAESPASDNRFYVGILKPENFNY